MISFIKTLIQSNTFNFLLVLAFFYWLIPKINLSEKLGNLVNSVKSYVGEAEKEKSNAQRRLNIIKNKIEKLPNEIKRIERSANNNIENLDKKSKEIIEEKKQDIDNNVKRIMDLETKKFKSKLTSLLSEASVNLARDNAVKQLENNREMHDKYIYDAIEEIDGIVL